MENKVTTDKVHMLESMVYSLNELLAVQEEVVRDQSEKLKVTLEALQNSEVLLNEVGEMAHVGGWELDVKTKAVHWTRETYRIHDIFEDEKFDLSKAVLFFDLPGRSILEGALQRCMETGEPFGLELPFTSAKGRHLWTRAIGRAVSVDGEVVKIEGAFQDITERKKVDLQVRERVKELQAFYGLAAITEREGITVDQLCQELTNLLPKSWQYNEIAYSRVVIDDSEFRTNNFTESPWKQSAPVKVLGSVVGKIEVGYLEERPEHDEGPFLKDERLLIDALAQRLGRIIERLRLEEVLEKSQIQLTEAMDLAHLVNWEFDVATGIFTFDDRFYALYGTTAEREGGNKMPAEVYAREFVHPDDQYMVADEVNKAIQATDPLFVSQVEHRIIRRDGEIRNIVVRFGITKDKNGRTIKTHGANQDITERKRAEEAMRESEERYRTLAESSPDQIFIVGRDDTMKYANATALKLFRLPFDQIVGRPRKELFPPEIAKSQEISLQNVFETGGSIKTEEKIQFGTQELWIDSSLVPLKDEAGDVTAILGVARDITGRKQIEESLMEAKALVEAIVENVPLMIFLKEATDLRFVIFNRAGEELLGYDRQALLGKNNLDLFPPEQAEQFMTKDREVLDGDAGMLDIPEEPITTGKKGVRLLHTRKVCIRGIDGTTKFLLGISEDITDQKRMEVELRTSEERFRGITERISDLIILVNPEGYITFMSPSITSILGFSPESYIGKRAGPDIIHAEDVMKIRQEMEKLKNGSPGEHVEFRMQKNDGSYAVLEGEGIPVFTQGIFGGVQVVARDITESKKMEAALRESRQLFSDIISFLPDATLVIDNEGKVLAWNRALEQLSGITSAHIVGKGDHEYSLWMYRKRRPILIDLVIDPHLDSSRVGYTNIQKDGSTITAETAIPRDDSGKITLSLVASPLFDSHGKVIGAIESMRDITQLKEAEAELKKYSATLEQKVSERTESLNTSLKEKEGLLKEIHHRVRNNLQVVSSIINLQTKSVSDPASLKQIQEIRMRIGTLALVHEIAYLAKTPESINMKDFLHRCSSRVIDEFGCEPGRINVTITAENVQVALNQAVPCSLIVNELLMNSIRHAFPHKRHGEINIGFSIAGGNYVLEYRDDGVGFPEGIQPDKAQTGGLSLIKGLAKQIRGTIESKTRPGTGYTLTFPAETGRT